MDMNSNEPFATPSARAVPPRRAPRSTKSRLLAAGAVLWLAAAGAGAGSYQDTLRAANAALHRFELENGLVCLVKEDRSAPVVAVQIWVRVGSVHEQEFLGGGLSHYLEHMVFKGTPTRGPAEVSKSIDNLGGDLNAYTSFDRTVYHAEIPSLHWKTAVDVLADAVLHAAMPEAEWQREREVVLREVDMGKDDPNRVLSKLLFATAYQVHPYRVPVIGYEDVLTRMTRDELITFHRRHYMPDNLIVSVVGDVDAAEVSAYLRELLSPAQRRARSPVVLPSEPPQLAPRMARKTGVYNVSRLEWAYPSTPLSHPDTPALDVLAQIVGQGRSSRLVLELKERRTLAFDISAWSFTPFDPGLFAISATFAPEKEAELIEAIEQEVRSWSEAPFSTDDIEKARRQVLASVLSELETAEGQASSFASGEFYAGDPHYSETYLQQLVALTPADLQRVARTYLQPQRRNLAILSPETAAEERPAQDAAVLRPVDRIALENGVTLLVREDHRLPFVHFSAALLGGLLSEQEQNNGISQLMADLLTRGTATRTAEEIAETVESLGGTLSAYAGRNSFGLNARCLSGDVETIAGLLADCLLHPSFPEPEIEKQKQVQFAAIRQQREQPMFLAQQSLMQGLYPGHPYRWNEYGTEASVGGITRDDLQAHWKSLVTSSNLVLSVFGDLTATQAVELVRRHFADLPAAAAPAWNHPRPAPALPLVAEQREPREQSILLLGYPGVALSDPRADILTIMAGALSGLSSDLLIEIRDRRGLVYYAGAFHRLGLDPGCFVFYAGTQEASVGEVRSLLEGQAERIRREGLNAEEWSRAMEQIIARSEKELQENSSLAQTCALNERYGLGFDYSFRTRARLEAISQDQIRAAAEELLREDRVAVSLVLPAGAAAAEAAPP